MKSPRTFKNTDWFIFINVGLFLLMCYVSYYDRFTKYRGEANVHEFFLYAIFLVGAMLWAERFFKPYTIPTKFLILAQVGITIHFAGGLVIVDGRRIYDLIILGIRYDKYVHFINASALAYALGNMAWFNRWERRIERDLVLFATILGFGAMIEIVEYLVTLTVKTHGVGDYDNNMCDMIANALGTISFIAIRRTGEYGVKDRAP